MLHPQLRLCEPSIELVLICSQGRGTIPPQPREELTVHLEPWLLASTLHLQRLDGGLCTPLWHLPTTQDVAADRATGEDVTFIW